jgi:molybdenum cofactor cytidylyltransferase
VPNDAKTGIAAVVLAAGSSRRMGRNKLLLELGGQSVLRTAARAAVDAGLQPVTVVLGHEAERVAAELAGLHCRTVVNPDHLRGVATSLHAGVKSLPAESSALVVVLGDMPFVTAAMIRSLVERYQATGARVVVSRYGDVEAPPTLFDRSVFPELLSVGGDRCARVVARRHESEGAVMAWPAGALRDLDVADDYAQARAALREN